MNSATRCESTSHVSEAQSLSSTFQYARSTKCFQRSCCGAAKVIWTNGRHFGRLGLRIKDVIQIKVTTIEEFAAVLAGVLVALKHVVSGEFYFLLRKPIEHKQHDHPRDLDLERDGRNHFMIGRVRGQIAPAFEVVRRKVVRVIRRNNLGVPCVYERKGAASGADVHRLPEPVEHQNLTVQ